MAEEWSEFVQAHGKLIGYDYDGVFLPVDGDNPRAVRIHELAEKRLGPTFGLSKGVPVYEPWSGEDTGSGVDTP